jgi:hypothetical protein
MEFDEIVKSLEECNTEYIDTLITRSLIVPLSDATYLEAGTFSSKRFAIRPVVAAKFKKEGLPLKDSYTLSEYSTLLTSYCIDKKCIDTMGILTPTPFLCKLFKIPAEPCSIVKLVGFATCILL